jgi:hypothetical protein
MRLNRVVSATQARLRQFSDSNFKFQTAKHRRPSLRALAKQSRTTKNWIASSQALLAMTTMAGSPHEQSDMRVCRSPAYRFAHAGNDHRTQLRVLATAFARGLQIHLPSKTRGRREDRVRAAPAVSRAKVANKNAHEHTGSAEAVRPSLRNGSTAYIVLSPARPGLFVTVIPKKLASWEFDTCHWGVRTTRLCRPLKRCSSIASLRPPHPAPTSVTIAKRPSSRARDSKE